MKNPKTKEVGDSLRVGLRGATQNDNIKKETGVSFTPPLAKVAGEAEKIAQNRPKTRGRKKFFQKLIAISPRVLYN